MDIFPIDWSAGDEHDDSQYTIIVFGKSPDGELVAARIRFSPYFFVNLPPKCSDAQGKLFVAEACAKHKACTQFSRVVERVSLWGFTGGAKLRLAQLAFQTRKAMLAAARTYQRQGTTTYESSLDPLMRFFHVRDIAPARWIRISKFVVVPEEDRMTRAAREVLTTFDVVFPVELSARPPLILASFDLECYSPRRKFPRSDNATDCIMQIATSFKRYGDQEPYRTVVLALKETAAVDGVDIVCFEEEADLINAWVQLLGEENADVIASYNGDQFDWKYVHGRSLVCVDNETGDPLVHLGGLGRMREGGGAARASTLSNAALGKNNFFTLTTPGILQIDLLQVLLRTMNLEKYSLNAVSQHFLGDTKVDLPPARLFECFEGGPADRARMAEYAAKDVHLPLRLMANLCTLENTMEMANATFCSMDNILRRGQQVRVFSPLMKKARAMGFACPDGKGIGPEGKFEGATVLDPVRGAHFRIVTVMDFASLYPSIMRAWQLDYSTLVLDERFAAVPGVEYYVVETDQGSFRFAQGFKGVLPSLLEDLATFRKRSKKDMAEAKARGDSFMQAIHDSKQQAYKIVMNTAYGFLGAAKGFLPCVPIAASVTATGRRMIQETRRWVEQWCPGSEVLYGDTDSVMAALRVPGNDQHDMKAHFELATTLAARISETFPRPVELEFEKCLYPFLIFAKKRYAAFEYTSPNQADKMYMKGLQSVRHDSCPIVKRTVEAVLNRILGARSAEEALDLAVGEARGAVLCILRGETPLEDFVTSKKLKDKEEYKNDMQPHVIVADKMLARKGFAPPCGSRVDFVYTLDGSKAKLACRAEDPDYARERKVPLDRLHYVHLVSTAAIPILECVAGNRAELLVFGASDVMEAMRDYKNTINKQHAITDYFGRAGAKRTPQK